jgi:hypothetical protein
MKKELKIAWVASLVIEIARALVWASKTQNFIFSRDLHVENFAVNGARIEKTRARLANIQVFH